MNRDQNDEKEAAIRSEKKILKKPLQPEGIRNAKALR